MTTIPVPLPEAAANELRALAREEFRSPRAQAALLLTEALAERAQAAEARRLLERARASEPPEAIR